MYESAGQFLQPGSHRAVDDQIISLQACTANQALVQIELQIYLDMQCLISLKFDILLLKVLIKAILQYHLEYFHIMSFHIVIKGFASDSL